MEYCLFGATSLITKWFKDFMRCVLYVTKLRIFQTVINKTWQIQNRHTTFCCLLICYSINQKLSFFDAIAQLLKFTILDAVTYVTSLYIKQKLLKQTYYFKEKNLQS